MENATGTDIDLIESKSFRSSHIRKYPVPLIIRAGQTVAFLHGHESGKKKGDICTLVLRQKDPDDQAYDIYLVWQTACSGTNDIYIEVQQPAHWGVGGSPECASLDWMYYNELSSSDSATFRHAYYNVVVTGSIRQSTSPVCRLHIG